MIKVYLKNLKNGEIFTKEFDSPYLYQKFMIKIRYSKKLQSLGKTMVY